MSTPSSAVSTLGGKLAIRWNRNKGALIGPASSATQGQGHLHYQVDNGPVIATTTTKLSFHELSAGQHKVMVMLVGNDHKPLGAEETLTVTIPQGKEGRARRQ
jgi:hypothetical protein